MKVLLIDNGTTLLEKLCTLIPGDEIVHRPNDIKISDSKNFDLIILSGSKDLTVKYDQEYFKKEIELIKISKIPLIGICLGCELIATAFGGTIKRLDERHSGIRDITAVSDNKILALEKGESYKVYEGHRWIIDTAPQNFDVLATSDEGPEIIKHNTLPIWGFQFHPENLTDQTEGDEIFLNLFSKLASK